MRLVKNWLFPVLTCLIVVGAAVLPPYVSWARDQAQFGQIHVDEMDAESLPVWEAPDLLERLELYVRWHTTKETIPSFQTSVMERALAERALNFLAQAGVISADLLQDPLERMNMSRILLWNPTDRRGLQQPVEFWRVSLELGEGSITMDVDGESGLPLFLNLYDPNIAQWFLYQKPDTLPDLAQRYFDLLELEAVPMQAGIPTDAAPWERMFQVSQTELYYYFEFNATTLNIGPEQNIVNLPNDSDF